ncbi:hypothetical protein [Actinophytocola xanthii]|nr:hypothetical protein [Actinophytocola xanthii]
MKAKTAVSAAFLSVSMAAVSLLAAPAAGAEGDPSVLQASNGYHLSGDWDGDGVDTPGVFRPGSPNTYYLRNSNSSGVADITVSFGGGGSVFPIVGDWDGDGDDTIGLVAFGSPNRYFLRNSNTSGVADITVTYGSYGYPLIGDWDGDGDDTIGLVAFGSPNTYYLRNSNTSGAANITLNYGGEGFPIAGDWDADGDDTVGLVRFDANGVVDNRWFLRNTNSSGIADVTFDYGRGGLEVIGDWDNTGDDNPGLVYPGQPNWWDLRNSNTTGPADTSFTYGS